MAEWPRPASGSESPRYAGPATFFRLPLRRTGLDIALFGVPFDGATTLRPGARLGPRALREASTLIRPRHGRSGLAPFELCQVADAGDAPVRPFDVAATLAEVEGFVAGLCAGGTAPLMAGGDHLMSLPVLRGLRRAGAAPSPPWGMVHLDAHSDTAGSFLGARFTHGTPFRHAVEEGLLAPARVVQIGLRGGSYGPDDLAWAREAGITLLDMPAVERMGVAGVVAEARRVIGTGPCWVSLDLDVLDPAFAPGTGTPEWGGLTPRELLGILDGLYGAQVVGGDVVELSPPQDHAGITALAGATLLFELLCLIAAARAG
ncbi:MAG: agmatinase [Roseococcus sp.]|nr:agmatinase [Roseococcus sp.]